MKIKCYDKTLGVLYVFVHYVKKCPVINPQLLIYTGWRGDQYKDLLAEAVAVG